MVSLADISISRSFEADDQPADDLTRVSMESVFTPTGGGGDERRMQVRAYNYWLGLASGDELPAIEDLRPEELDDLGPSGVLLDLTLGKDNPSILFIGDRLSEACGEGAEIFSAGDVPGRSLLARLTEHSLEVVANRSPVGFDAEFVDVAGRLILYRSILLPFSSDGKAIDFIFGVISWKEDEAAAAPPPMLAISPAPAPEPPAPARPALEAAAPLSLGRIVAPVAPSVDVEPAPAAAPAPAPAAKAPETLADLLSAARNAAQLAGQREDRTRVALYAALSRAYDLALAAHGDPADYAEMLAEAGIATSAASPMLPLARLVFGAYHDKTRLAEYAAVLEHAARHAVGRGELAELLAAVPGGLRAVVGEERRLRREVAGKPARRHEVRAGIAYKLRNLKDISVSPELGQGCEFVLLVARRDSAGRIAVLGSASDLPLLEAAARRLLASPA